jgi:tetratricopeptide (TPR) repeat protein
MSAKRFRIAFSFAGEKRNFVAEVAAILARRFGEEAILYDKYHEAEFARYDLGIYLPKLYRDQSDLIVAVLCPEYDQKVWTGWEWMAIYAQLTKAEGSQIMLCRFDRAHVDGLFEAAAFVELDDKTPEQTATRILERLAINEGKAKDYYSVDDPTSARVPTTNIPNNLPRLQPFFGRTDELRQIAEALDPQTRTWGTLIDGPGGMGKTSLAVRAAYDCTPEQFDRIIFLSVKDRELDDDGERELGPFILPGFLEMLNELARELGQPEITKAVENERIRLILDALERSRTLLILDNLESLTKSDRDQLFTFVKRLPQGCKAILTSRRRIGSGSDLLILEKLDEGAALETLADLARHNPLLARTSEAERLTLYHQTGGKPLLLRWVAGQIGRGNCRTFTDALHFLRNCPPDNDPLEFIFGDLVNEFTADETKVLAALSYFILPTRVEHIAEVSDLNDEPVEASLRTLANRSLVVPDQEERVFSLVPMVADFLRRTRPEVIADIGSRLEEHAYALIAENGDEQHDRFPILDAAWSTLAPALPLFVAGPNERLQVMCDALAFFLEFTGRWDESQSLNQQAEVRALAVGDHTNVGWGAYRVGYINYLRQEADAVLACAERASTHFEIAKAGARERALAIQLRGFSYMLKEDYSAAVIACREVLDLHRTVSGESKEVAVALNSLANAEKYSGDDAAAERDYREALRVARAIEYDQGVATYIGNLAALALDRKDWPSAETLAREALPLSERTGRLEAIATDCHRLAKTLLRQGKKDEALPYAQRAVEMFTRLGVSPDIDDARGILDECEA